MAKPKAKFFCENCGAEVSANAKFCSKCGRLFTSVRCPICGHTGPSSAFINGCPNCGYAVYKKNKNKNSKKKRKASNKIDTALPLWIYILTIIILGGLIYLIYLYLK